VCFFCCHLKKLFWANEKNICKVVKYPSVFVNEHECVVTQAWVCCHPGVCKVSGTTLQILNKDYSLLAGDKFEGRGEIDWQTFVSTAFGWTSAFDKKPRNAEINERSTEVNEGGKQGKGWFVDLISFHFESVDSNVSLWSQRPFVLNAKRQSLWFLL